MKRAMMLLAVCGLSMTLGCEDKQTPAPAGSTADKLKAAGEKTAEGLKEAGKATADATKAAVDKTKEAGASAATSLAEKANAALATEVNEQLAKLKAQLTQLKTGGASLTGTQKTDFDASVTTMEGQFKTLSDDVAKAGTLSADAIAKRYSELKDRGRMLLENIKATADKYAIKLT